VNTQDENVVSFIPKGTFTDQERIAQVRAIITKEELTFREKGELFNDIKLDKGEVSAIGNASQGKGDPGPESGPGSMSTKEIIEEAGGAYTTYKNAGQFVECFPTVESQKGLNHSVCLALMVAKNHIDKHGLGDDAFRQLCLAAQKGERFDGEFSDHGYSKPWKVKETQRAVAILTGKLTPQKSAKIEEQEERVMQTVTNAVSDLPRKVAVPIENAVRKEVKLQTVTLQRSFEDEVNARVKAIIKEKLKEKQAYLDHRIEEANELYSSRLREEKRVKLLSRGIKGVMSKDEFKLIRGCLHTDRVPEDQKDKFHRAFIAFNKLSKLIEE
jgi:hypothetical protein